MKPQQNQFLKFSILSLLSAAIGAGVSADTFLWNGGNFGKYSDPANWQIISTVDSTVVTNTATRFPNGNDSFADPQKIFADLDEKEWEIKNFDNCVSKPWGRGIFNFTNGLLRVKNSAVWHGTDGSANATRLFDGATLEMASTSTFLPGEGDGATHYLKVYPNAALNIFGTLRIYKFDLEVQAGGTANISPSQFKARGGSTQDSYLRNSGTMTFGNGITLSEGSWSGYKLDVIQNDGTMIFGGPVNKNGMAGTYTIEFKKGTVKTLADVSFAFDNQKISDNADLLFDVAADTTCDLSNFTLGSNVQISKSGAGTLITRLLNGKVSDGVVIPDECGTVEFAGGKVLLVASGDGFPVIPTATLEAGAKIKIGIRNLVGLKDGSYPVISSCTGITDADLELFIEDGERVNASLSIENGVVILHKTNDLANTPTLTWDLNASPIFVWSESAWQSSPSGWVNGSIAKFGNENSTEKISVLIDQLAVAAQVTVEGNIDCQFDGRTIRAPKLVKTGTGTLTLNNGGVTGRSIELGGGELVLGGAAEYVEPTEVIVADGATVSIKGAESPTAFSRLPSLFQWNSNNKSMNYWLSRTEYEHSAEVDAFDDLMVKDPKFPTATDSLSLMDIRLTGTFYVAATETGITGTETIPWEFQGMYDDRVRLLIDNTEVFTSPDWNKYGTGSAVLNAGPHTFEVRAVDTGYDWANANWLEVKKPGSEKFQTFSEKNLRMGWVASDAPTAPAPERMVLKLTLGENCDLTIGSAGLELTEDSVIDATATISIDYLNIPANTTFIKCATAAQRTILCEKIAVCLGSIGTVIETEDGVAWKMNAIFTGGSEHLTDLMVDAGWADGMAAPTGGDVTITDGAAAVMSATVPDYGSISLLNNSSLTVQSSRDLNRVSLAAGTTLTITAEDNTTSTVIAQNSFTTTGSGSVTVNVAEGCVLDLRGITLTFGAKLVKTGMGAILFDQANLANLEIQAGTVAFPANTSFNSSDVQIADGVTCLAITQSGGVRPAIKTEDEEHNTFAYASEPIAYSGVGNWNDLANWQVIVGLPDANDPLVRIIGEGTVATLDTVQEMPGAIEVGDGAELIIAAGITLPPITLAPTAKLTLGDGVKSLNFAVTALPLTSAQVTPGENGAATVVSIPQFTISKKVLFMMIGNAYFKNVDLRVFGELRTSTNTGGLYFGYAEADEITYFNMVADGATLHPVANADTNSGGKGDASSIACFSFASPAEGGRVIVLDEIRLKDCKYTINGWNDYHKCFIGVNNPVDAPFDLIIDSGLFELHDSGQIGGAAHIKCINGGEVRFTMGHPEHGYTHVKDRAYFDIVGENSVLDSAARISKFYYSPTDADFETIRLSDGGIYKTSIRPDGNGNALLRSEDGVVMIPKMPSCSTELPKVQTYELLKGLKGANIIANKTLTILGKDAECGRLRNNGQVSWSQWDRKVTVSNLITGEGDLVVQNEVADNSMEVTIVGGNNTCTGEIRCDGENNAKILFADGANWAGTVVANAAVSFAGAEPAEITVNQLKLVEGFKLRFWRDEHGVITCDKINFNTCVAENNAALAFDPQDNGEALARTDRSFIIGSMPKNAVMPKMPAHWQVVALPCADNADRVLLQAKANRGIVIVVQ